MARKTTRITGRNIKKLRKERGLTQEALGDLAGTDKSHICRIESGKISPSLQTARALATALRVSLDDLAGFSTQHV